MKAKAGNQIAKDRKKAERRGFLFESEDPAILPTVLLPNTGLHSSACQGAGLGEACYLQARQPFELALHSLGSAGSQKAPLTPLACPSPSMPTVLPLHTQHHSLCL